MTNAMTTRYAELLRLRPGVYLSTTPSGELRLLRRELWRHMASFGALTPVKRAVLGKLAEGPCPVEEIRDEETAELLDALLDGDWLTTTVRGDGEDLYTIQPVHSGGCEPYSGEELVLSRFALLRREGADLVVESPVAHANLLVHSPAVVGLIGGLARPATPAGPIAERLFQDLWAAGLAVRPGSEESDVRLRQWRPHELWFHGRSRCGNGGYSDGGFGRTNWAKDTFDQLPAKPEPFPGPTVELAKPDLESLRANDISLTSAIEDRMSVREHDDAAPMTLDQLGELLYRAARVRNVFVQDGVEYLRKPYPSGGSAFELELYPVVRNVSGLAPGMYHYDSHEHRLELVRPASPEVGRLLWTATQAAVMPEPPQALLVVSARFGRLMRTYEEIPYSLVLKHVGVLYQTLYLVATSMGLAACGLGAGDSAAFAELTGHDHTTEGCVGEFLIGSRPAELKGVEYGPVAAS